MARAIVLLMDRDGSIRYYNAYLEELSGIPLSEAQGKEWFSTLLPERDHERIRSLYRHALAGEPVIGYVNPIRTRSGAERDIEWSGTFVQDAQGETLGVLSVGIDVTARRQLAEKERLATIGTTASMFAHEIANPLNNMTLQGKLLSRRLEKMGAGDEVVSSLTSILDEVRRLGGLLEEFRSLAQRQRVEPVETNLCDLVDEVLHLHASHHESADIRLERELPDDLPPILASPDKLKQVLVNLLKNAAEAMPRGGTLCVRGGCSDDAVTLQVEDTGEGIPEGADVFQPFETSKEGGTGLGLPIAQQIVLAHGGNLSYESEVGKGTTFTMRLPVAKG